MYSVTKNNYPTLKRGDRGEQVKELQRLLNPRMAGPDRIQVDGIFGDETEFAVQEVQYQFFLKQDGIANEHVWKCLYAKAPVIHPVIRVGSQNELVKRIQEVMYEHGLYSGEINGVFDARLESNIKNFQRSRNLVADGVIGPKTWKALCDIATFVTVES